MSAETLELEGTWEEVAAHAGELAGRRVRLTVLPEHSGPAESSSCRPSSGRSLLQHSGSWEGDDLEERLAEALESRTPVRY